MSLSANCRYSRILLYCLIVFFIVKYLIYLCCIFFPFSAVAVIVFRAGSSNLCYIYYSLLLLLLLNVVQSFITRAVSVAITVIHHRSWRYSYIITEGLKHALQPPSIRRVVCIVQCTTCTYVRTYNYVFLSPMIGPNNCNFLRLRITF